MLADVIMKLPLGHLQVFNQLQELLSVCILLLCDMKTKKFRELYDSYSHQDIWTIKVGEETITDTDYFN